MMMAVPKEDKCEILGVENLSMLSIARVAEVQVTDSNIVKLIKLRSTNSADSFEWGGKYAVASKNWNPSLMKTLDKVEIDANRTLSEECCFWVDEEEFRS